MFMKCILFLSLIGLALTNPINAITKSHIKTEFCKCNPCKCDPCTCGIKCECCKSDKDCQDCSCKCTQGSECSCTSSDKACRAKNS